MATSTFVLTQYLQSLLTDALSSMLVALGFVHLATT